MTAEPQKLNRDEIIFCMQQAGYETQIKTQNGKLMSFQKDKFVIVTNQIFLNNHFDFCVHNVHTITEDIPRCTKSFINTIKCFEKAEN